MEITSAAQVFAILGHTDRLSVFRLLMRFAPQGQRPTEIAVMLGLKQNTLSHHLRDLVSSGLVHVTRHGRSLYYAVDLDAAEALIAYLALDVGRARPDLLPAIPGRGTDMPPDLGRMLNVMFICSGNSARSIMAEVLLRDLGVGRFRAYSAGTRPGRGPNAAALYILAGNGHDISGLYSKHLRAFQVADAPQMDFVFTVCDRSAAEDCPPLRGYPVAGHWGLPDPVGDQNSPDADHPAFARTYTRLRRKIEAFLALPVNALDRRTIQTCIDAIGVDA